MDTDRLPMCASNMRQCSAASVGHSGDTDGVEAAVEDMQCMESQRIARVVSRLRLAKEGWTMRTAATALAREVSTEVGAAECPGLSLFCCVFAATRHTEGCLNVIIYDGEIHVILFVLPCFKSILTPCVQRALSVAIKCISGQMT